MAEGHSQHDYPPDLLAILSVQSPTFVEINGVKAWWHLTSEGSVTIGWLTWPDSERLAALLRQVRRLHPEKRIVTFAPCSVRLPSMDVGACSVSQELVELSHDLRDLPSMPTNVSPPRCEQDLVRLDPVVEIIQ